MSSPGLAPVQLTLEEYLAGSDHPNARIFADLNNGAICTSCQDPIPLADLKGCSGGCLSKICPGCETARPKVNGFSKCVMNCCWKYTSDGEGAPKVLYDMIVGAPGLRTLRGFNEGCTVTWTCPACSTALDDFDAFITQRGVCHQ